MAQFDEFWKALTGAISGLAVGALKDYRDQVIKDGTAFIEGLKGDMQRWTGQFASGQLSPDRFEWLLGSKKDEAELTALTQAGLAKAARDKFVNDVIATILSTATKFFPKV